MLAFGIARTLFRKDTVVKSSQLLKRVVDKKFSVRKLCVSAATNNEGTGHIYKSPYADVEIPDISIIDFLKQKCQNYDDRIAMVCAETGEEVRYGQVWQRVHSVASALARLGVAKGSTVALVVPNCPEFVVAFLATASLGATVTTVNCLYTAEEIRVQLEDSIPQVVVYHPAMGAAVQAAVQGVQGVQHLVCTHLGAPAGQLSLPDLYQDNGTACPTDLQVEPSEDVLVLPYSSGTTGLPKGVMLTHSNVVSNLQQCSHPQLMKLHAGDSGTEVMFGVLPMFHIYGMTACVILSLATGSTCVTFSKFDPQLYIASLIKYKPTVLHCVPPILQFLAQTPQVAPEYLSSVHTLTCGAAPAGEALVKQVMEKFTHGLNVQEGYGMTELSPVSHMAPGGVYVPGSCGVPVPNTLAKLIDVETKAALPLGDAKGELCIKGPQVMKGYFRNEAATAATIDPEGWLHTGDVAHIDAHGNCFIVERLKELIKVKGFQVAPAELEDLLRSCPGVSDVAVIGVPDDKSGELPRAFVVKNPNHEAVTETSLQEFVAARVSAHKQLAGGVVFVESIPKSMTGKILRKDLREQFAKQ